MKADILRQGYEDNAVFNPTDEVGEWVNQQDEDSGEIIRKWEPNTLDDPDTVENEGAVLESFNCEARGIVDGGVRVAGTTERFGQMYEDIDYVKITFPISTKISRRDRITNIRDQSGNVVWKEEDQPDAPPTVFEVTGVTPIIAPFVGAVEQFALLKRAQRQ